MIITEENLRKIIEDSFESLNYYFMQNYTKEDIDKIIEKKILSSIFSFNPHCKVITEEVGVITKSNSPSQTIILDPIDGTWNFLRGIPIYSIAAALINKDVSKVTTEDIDYSIVVSTFGIFEARKGDFNNKIRSPENFTYDLMRGSRAFRSRLLGASTIELGLLANGSFDVFIEEKGLKLVDIIPILLYLHNSDCVITNLDGSSMSFDLIRPKEARYTFIAAASKEKMNEYQYLKDDSSFVVLVTGAGAPAGINAINSLVNKNLTVIGVSSDAYSPGFKKCSKSYVVPLAKDDNYIDELISICKIEKIDLIIPTVDEELEKLSHCREIFNENRIALAMSNNEVNSICMDKWKFYQFMDKNNFSTPNTHLVENSYKPFDSDYPLFAKPRRGRGSKGIQIIYDESDYNDLLNRKETYILQELVDGIEYSVDILCDLNGKMLSAVPRIREEIKAGICWRGRTVRDANMIEYCRKIVEKLGITGPACLQLFKTDKGEFVVFEINVRIGGTTSLSIEAGLDIPFLLTKIFRGQPIENKDLEYREIIISRYFADEFFEIID